MEKYLKENKKMLKILKKSIHYGFGKIGYSIEPLKPNELLGFPPDFDQATIQLCRYVQSFTMTSKERILALRKSVEYIIEQDIPGDIVECGVWKGGSMMVVARTLLEKGVDNRTLYLFDTFEGMAEPTDVDINYLGNAAKDRWKPDVKWAYSPLDEVKCNMQNTGYDENKILFIKGKVQDTLPEYAPENISLLRLDTDWYESTYHELLHLYPRLSVGGVLIIDDYGFWEGSRKAVDQYIKERNLCLLLNRIDKSGRICIKHRQ